MRLFQSLAMGLALAALTFASTTAKAVTQTNWEYNRLNRPSDTVGALGNGLFGEQVDLYSGGTEFATTDISIPGNGSLPVRLGRRLEVAEADQYGGLQSFANWEVDVPYLTTYLASLSNTPPGWVLASGTTNRCSVPLNQPQSAGPPNYQGTDSDLSPWDYWSGYQMYVPGAGSQEMLVDSTASPAGSAYHWTTKDNWVISCVGLQSGGTGEGFVATSPQGVTYTFDRMLYRGGAQNQVLVKEWTNGSGQDVYFRYKYWIVASSATDRFGNTVHYNYNASNELTSITATGPTGASDGRSVTINWGTDGNIQTASDGTHTWTYNYATATAVYGDNRIPEVLTSVVQPDTSSWSYQYGGSLVLTDTRPTEDPPPVTCTTPEWKRLTGEAVTGNSTLFYTFTATHPSGEVGTFQFAPLIRGRSNVTQDCFDEGALYPKESAQFALQSKTLSDPILPSQPAYTWAYTWEPLETKLAEQP